MSDLWKELLSREAPALDGILELNRVRVTRDVSNMEVSFYASRLLTGDEINNIRNAFAGAFTGTKISIVISYPALSGDVRASIKSYVPFLIDVLAHSQPACRGFLANTEWRLDNDRLTIRTENESDVSYLKANEIPARLRKIIRDLFGIECEAEVLVNTSPIFITPPMTAMDAETSEVISQMFDD